MEFDKETFRKLFPNLAREMESGENKTAIDSVRTDIQTGKKQLLNVSPIMTQM